MIKVMVRHIDSTEGKVLGHFQPEQLDTLVEVFKYEAITLNGFEEDLNFVGAQFKDVGSVIVYEIVVE